MVCALELNLSSIMNQMKVCQKIFYIKFQSFTLFTISLELIVGE